MDIIRNSAFTLAIIACNLLCNNEAIAQVDSSRVVNEAMQLINFPEPSFSGPFNFIPTPKSIADMGLEQPNMNLSAQYKMEDGVIIKSKKYPFDGKRTAILVHGVLSNNYTFNKMAGLVRDALNAEVIAIDLRGHGESGGKPGDIAESNQYASDLNTIIRTIKEAKPSESIVLVGHSMGGGIILRHAETFNTTEVDGYLLFAPNLGPNSPTTSSKIDLKNNFIQTHLSRGLGLKMLNEMGIHDYDSMKVVFYNPPNGSPIKSYTYRSSISSYPEDLKGTLKNLKAPIITVVGAKDEAFIADEYPTVFNAYSSGECHLFDGETHNGIRHNEKAFKVIKKWADKKL